MARAASTWWRDLIGSFADLRRLPRGFWLVVGAFVVESCAYFGVLTLMTTYLATDLGWGDRWAGLTVSVFTMSITLLMLGPGSYAERFGVRRAILFALFFSTCGRVAYSSAAALGHGSTAGVIVVVISILVVATGSGILQPVCYAGVKQYTDEQTNSMGYGLIYALMNAWVVVAGALSAWIRPAVQAVKDGQPAANDLGGLIIRGLASFSGSGVQAFNWIAVGITALTFLLFLSLMTRQAEAAKLRPDRVAASLAAGGEPWSRRLRAFFSDGPFTNGRFVFFIFMLLPVRTMFAHQWLTFPQYILRAYPEGVADRMEWLVNWINPGIVFVGVPVATALTRRVDVYTMMIIGTLVSAAPTFLLAFGARLDLLILYFVIYSIGETLWSARFYEYASELAPPGKVAHYLGLANVPWLLAKGTTGLYSGYMLATYCPAGVPRAELHTEAMWVIYGCIAMISPIGLWLARKWVRAGAMK